MNEWEGVLSNGYNMSKVQRQKTERQFRELQFGVNKIGKAKQEVLGDEAREATMDHVEEPIVMDLTKGSLSRDVGSGKRRRDNFCLWRP